MIVKFRSMKNMQFYFRVLARNHRIIAQSEGYRTKRARDNGIAALFKVVRYSVKCDVFEHGLTRRYDA